VDQGNELAAVGAIHASVASRHGLLQYQSVETPCGEAAWLANRFGFTLCEARVALLIAKGCSPSRVASKLGISLNTVRSHLKRVFAKSDTHRQAELVLLLLTVLYSR